MRLAVMQPYFLPYQGYFSLIASVDEFMFFDDVQYQRKSWMSRNRLLNIETGEPYYIRPDIIKPKYQENLMNVKLDTSSSWKSKLQTQFSGYKRSVPFFHEGKQLLDEILDLPITKLVDFNIQSIIHISNYLGLSTNFSKFSDKGFWFEDKPNASTWGLEIAKSMKAKEYINAPGGESFIMQEGFTENTIRLGFIQPNLNPKVSIPSFKPGMSILDVIAFYGKEEVTSLVHNYSINWKN